MGPTREADDEFGSHGPPATHTHAGRVRKLQDSLNQCEIPRHHRYHTYGCWCRRQWIQRALCDAICSCRLQHGEGAYSRTQVGHWANGMGFKWDGIQMDEMGCTCRGRACQGGGGASRRDAGRYRDSFRSPRCATLKVPWGLTRMRFAVPHERRRVRVEGDTGLARRDGVTGREGSTV